jgi:hypothetical protein
VGTYSKEITGKGFRRFKLMEAVHTPPHVMNLEQLVGFFPDLQTFLTDAGVTIDTESSILCKPDAVRIMRHYREEFAEAYKVFEGQVLMLAENKEFGELVRVTTSIVRDALFHRIHAHFLSTGFSIGDQKAFALMLFAVFSQTFEARIVIDFDQDHDEENERLLIGVGKENGGIKRLSFKI